MKASIVVHQSPRAVQDKVNDLLQDGVEFACEMLAASPFSRSRLLASREHDGMFFKHNPEPVVEQVVRDLTSRLQIAVFRSYSGGSSERYSTRFRTWKRHQALLKKK